MWFRYYGSPGVAIVLVSICALASLYRFQYNTWRTCATGEPRVTEQFIARYEPLGPLLPTGEVTRFVVDQQHADLERMEDCLLTRARYAISFADRKAEEWDEIGSLLHNSSASLLALANLVPRHLTVADLGTGTGVMLPFLSALGNHVYAVDQSPKMLNRARLRCRQLGIDNVTFVQAAIEELDQQLPQCDGLLVHFVLHQIARPQTLLKHAAKYLLPGGRLVIIDRTQHQDEKAKTTFGSVWLGFASDQLEEWLAEAGLSGCVWQTVAGIEKSTDTSLGIFVLSAVKPTSA